MAINSNGTGTPNAFKANTSLGFGHSTGVDPLPLAELVAHPLLDSRAPLLPPGWIRSCLSAQIGKESVSGGGCAWPPPAQ